MRPVLFEIGSFPVRAYGIMVLAGFLLALAYAVSQARKDLAKGDACAPGAIRPEHVFDMSVMGLFLGIVGARALYVLLNLREFLRQPLEAFKVWTGGVSIHGAIIAAILWLAFYSRRQRIAFFRFADLCAPAFALGYAVGRIGCFLNGCCYGHACDLPWAVRFYRDGDYGSLTPPSHPTQLYAAVANLAFFVLLHLWRKRRHVTGDIFFGYLVLYSVYRFVDEAFRREASAVVLAAGLTYAQVFTLLALAWRSTRARSAHQLPEKPDGIDGGGAVC